MVSDGSDSVRYYKEYLILCRKITKIRVLISGQIIRDVGIGSREEAAKCLQGILRQRVRVSSARQAISGFLAVGGVNGTRYIANKISKAWKSWR